LDGLILPKIRGVKLDTSFIKKIGAIALAMVFFLFFTPVPAGALTPLEVAKLVASDGASEDFFGYSVAVDGDTAVIGAYGDDNTGSNSGSAYVFIRSDGTWVQQARLAASDGASSDYFGYSVAVDGDMAVIGAYGDSDNGTNSGSAYVFIRSGSSWVQQAKLSAPGGAAYHYFGYSVAGNGGTILIGAFGDGDNGSKSGAAYVFIRSDTSWVQQARLTASDWAAGDYFGYSVAVDGHTAVIGAYGDDDNGINSGSAYVFIRSGNTWVQQAKLMAPDGVSSDFFGYSVAVDGDTAAVIGVRYDDDNGTNSGSAYVFSLIPPDSDGDGVPDSEDNYPDIPNPDQTEPDSDIPGDGCDVNIDAEAVVGAIESECRLSVDILAELNPPGVKGMISKLTGNGGVAAKVAKAVYDYADCNIDEDVFIDQLNVALDQLNAYDAQLEGKIDSGKIKGKDALLLEGYSDDASLLEAYSDNMRTTINSLISDAIMP
jgi:hypothetical protein